MAAECREPEGLISRILVRQWGFRTIYRGRLDDPWPAERTAQGQPAT